jgi:hypothetical protein
MHANNLRKFNLRVDNLESNLLTSETDSNEINPQVSTCSVIYDSDVGDIVVVESPDVASKHRPSQRIDSDKIEHLSVIQQKQLFAIFHKVIC